MDGHPSRPRVAARLVRPNPGASGEQPSNAPLFGLAPGGACRAGLSPGPLVGSYPTVSPLPAPSSGLVQPRRRPLAVCSSVALSLGFPRLDVIQRPALRCPDFPRRPACRPARTEAARRGAATTRLASPVYHGCLLTKHELSRPKAATTGPGGGRPRMTPRRPAMPSPGAIVIPSPPGPWRPLCLYAVRRSSGAPLGDGMSPPRPAVAGRRRRHAYSARLRRDGRCDHDCESARPELQPTHRQQQRRLAARILRAPYGELPRRGGLRDGRPQRAARGAVPRLRRVRQTQERRPLRALRAGGEGRCAGRARQDGRLRRLHRGHPRLLRPALGPVLQVHHAHPRAAPPGLPPRQPRRRRHGHRRAALPGARRPPSSPPGCR